MKYTIQWEPEGTIVTFNGVIDMNDIMSANYVVNGDERYYTHSYTVWDFTNCDLSRIHSSDIMRPVAIDIGASRSLSELRVALVVNDDYSLKIAQLYIDKCISIGLPWQFAIFDKLSDAYEWSTSQQSVS